MINFFTLHFIWAFQVGKLHNRYLHKQKLPKVAHVYTRKMSRMLSRKDVLFYTTGSPFAWHPLLKDKEYKKMSNINQSQVYAHSRNFPLLFNDTTHHSQVWFDSAPATTHPHWPSQAR